MNAESLLDLLDAEHRALTTGEYEAMPDLIARKEAIRRSGVDTRETDPGTLVSLSEKAERNAALLDAAQRGFASARQDIREIRSGLTQTTYDARGQRSALAAGRGRMERKV